MEKTIRFLISCLAAMQLLAVSGCTEDKFPSGDSLTFTVDIVSAGTSSISACVTPSSDSDDWYASAVTAEVFESYSDNNSFAAAMKADLLYRIQSGTDKSTLVFKGKKTVEFTGLEEDTGYVIFAFGLDENMDIISELATKESATVADDTFFTVDFSGITSVRMEAKVTPEDPEMTYNFAVSSKKFVDSFESDDEYISEYKQWLLAKYGSYADALSSGETWWEATALTPETEYYVIIIGMDKSGDLTTPVCKFPFVTEPVQMIDMDLDIQMDMQHNTAQYTITPSSQDNWHFHAFVKKADAGEFTDDELFRKCLDEATADLKVPGLGYTYEDIMKIVGKTGTFSGEKTLLSETDWVMLAGGINSDLQVNTKVVSCDFRTGKAHLDYTIKGKATDITPVSARIEITFSGPMYYYYKLHTKEFVDSFSSDEELIDALDFTTGNGLHLFYEVSLAMDEKGLKPGEEYCAVAVGYNEGPATAPARIYFTTPEEGDASGLTVELEAVPFAESAEVTFTPSADNVLYAYDNVAAGAWEEALAANGNDPDAAARSLFEAKIQELSKWYTREEAAATFSAAGKSTYKFLWLSEQSDYVTWTLPLDSDMNPAGKCFTCTFTTGTQGRSDLKAKITNVRYFQMAQLREEFPQASWWEGNNPVIVYEIEPDPQAYHWYSSMWYQEAVDETADEDIFEYLFPFDEGKDLVITSIVGDWDIENQFVAFAVDKNGNYGPIDRYSFVPTMDGSSPASEFPVSLLTGADQASNAPRPAPAKRFSPEIPPMKVPAAAQETAQDNESTAATGIIPVRRLK